MKSKQQENDCIADEFSSDNCSSRTEKIKDGESGIVGGTTRNQFLSFFFPPTKSNYDTAPANWATARYLALTREKQGEMKN